jgi:hypothetical protein
MAAIERSLRKRQARNALAGICRLASGGFVLRQLRRTRTGFARLSIRVLMARARSGARFGWWHSRLCWKADAALDCVRAIMSCRGTVPARDFVVQSHPAIWRDLRRGIVVVGRRRSPGRYACSQKSAASVVLVGAFRSSPPQRLPSGLAIAKIECGDGQSTGAQFSRIPRRNASARG